MKTILLNNVPMDVEDMVVRHISEDTAYVSVTCVYDGATYLIEFDRCYTYDGGVFLPDEPSRVTIT